jgi:tyrosyl-tRNA synthetase
MSVPDEVMGEYCRLLLDPRSAGAPPSSSPPAVTVADEPPVADEPQGRSAMDAKRTLARELVTWLHSAEDAVAAERHFDRVHVERQEPETIEEATFHSDNGLVHLPAVMAEEFGISRSQARRLIDEGGVTLGEIQLAAGEHDVPGERADGQVLKVGKRRFRRLRAR